MKNILFDISDPYKIDLESFMQKNYHFNVKLDRFAYLTGRSLATFKRDFEKIFGTAPRKWLLEKRLKEAHYLLKTGRRASDIYLDLGFENLSHFSFAFKKQYGLPPSMLSV
ncbi:helix-turn-helix domain-containing protein [Chryseobacterium carnipullorum]|uniref:Transcriptional activator FtrA n=1 Tax=Chryseobacterium carnipullorum TaxID=1124835 RepID=A0A376DMH4_CHRCU|nr:AraC family transcriptional regulator [Chryseobacterium carnipullorum]STC92146.1 transcriptional activator FtrA [Chryseobacterium carnipullorum]